MTSILASDSSHTANITDLQVSISETESVDSLEDQRCVFEIELEKDKSGLGLTVAGYICEKGGNSFIV